MAWTNARFLLKLSSHRLSSQRQSFASTTTDGSSGQRPGPTGGLESESGSQLNMDGFPSASKGRYMESLFSKWLKDKNSIHGTWQRFFRELVEDKANPSPSARSDSPTPGSGETLADQPKLGSALPAKGSVSETPKKLTRSMSQKTPREPEQAAKCSRSFFKKCPKFRWLTWSTKRKGRCLHKVQRIPGQKRRSQTDSRKSHKYATVNFKNFYEDKINKEKARQAKLREAEEAKDISKDNKLAEKHGKKPLPSHLGGDTHTLTEDYSPNGPKIHTYESLESLIDNVDNTTINMAWPDPIHQEKVKKVQLWNADEALELWKGPSDETLLTDSEQSSKSEDQVWISQEKATKDITSVQDSAGPEQLSTERFPMPIGDVNEESSVKGHQPATKTKPNKNPWYP